MTTIEDELRAVLSASSAADSSSLDRRASVARRIKHHQRVRATAGATVIALVLILSGGIALVNSGRTHRPAPVASPNNDRLTSAAPGHLPDYADGGKLVTYDTGRFTDQTTLNVTFTPTTWDFQIGTACAAADSSLSLVVKVNGHPSDGVGCDKDGGPDVGGPSDPNDWANFGVRLGQPMTISTVLTRSRNLQVGPKPATNLGTGTMSVGVYVPVPWQSYPFPSRPATLPSLGRAEMNLPTALANVTATGPTAPVQVVTLPAQIQMAIDSVAPGMYLIYFNEVQVDACDLYDWGGGCVGAIEDVGKGALAGFHAGEKVQVRVVTGNVGPHDQWRMQLAGSK